MAEQFKWVSFYTEFATKLLKYKTNRGSLIGKMQKVYSDIGMKLPKLEKDNIPKNVYIIGIVCMRNSFWNTIEKNILN